MAATVRVPTIFTAVDRITAPIRKMGNAVGGFAARSNRLFRAFTPSISEATKQILSFVSSAALISTIFAGVSFSTKSLIDYNKQLASFRTIVSDLSDADFSKFRSEISKVAKESKGMASTIDVASSFEKIAGLNADFAKTATGLGLVSKAAITLSKASGDDLGTSAENLVGIMNQFKLGAEEANRVINVLAAGQAVGAATITQASESYKNFGSVAKGSNITLEQSIGLIQTLGKFSIFGAEAGTALRGATLKLQKAGIGYKSGQFQINDALEQTRRHYERLGTAKKKDAYLLKIFGAENITAGRILVNNIDTYKDFTKAVTGTSEAQKAAGINAATFSSKIDGLKNKWITYVTSNDQANTSLGKAGKIIDWVGDNIDALIGYVGTYIGLLVAWKVGTIALVAWQTALAFILKTENAELLIAAARVIAFTGAWLLNKVATIAVTGATYAMTAAQWLLNAALDANPIGLVILAIAAIIAIIRNWSAITKWFGKIWAKFTAWISELWDDLIKGFKNFSFTDFFMNIGKSILKYMLSPLRAILSLAANLPGVLGSSAAKGLKLLDNLTADVNVTPPANPPKPLSPPAVAAQVQNNQQNLNGNLNINLNDPGRMVESVTPSGPLKPNVKTTSTQGSR